MLGEKEKLSVEDCRRMQSDLVSMPARELVPRMLEVEREDEWSRRALTLVRAWDHRLAADSVGACVYEVFFTHLVRKTLEEKLGSWSEFYMGRGMHPLRPNGSFFQTSASWLLSKMRQRKKWFAGKSWKEAMEEALASAGGGGRRLLGEDGSPWQGGRLHRQGV